MLCTGASAAVPSKGSASATAPAPGSHPAEPAVEMDESGCMPCLAAPAWSLPSLLPLEPVHDPSVGRSSALGLAMLRWLFFRLMYLAGIVKLTSRCPTWWGLTAMIWHYESQCLPTPAAWYAHQLPHWFQVCPGLLPQPLQLRLPPLTDPLPPPRRNRVGTQCCGCLCHRDWAAVSVLPPVAPRAPGCRREPGGLDGMCAGGLPGRRCFGAEPIGLSFRP